MSWLDKITEAKKAIDEAFGSPKEALAVMREITSGERGKQLDSILTRITQLSKNGSMITEAVKLLELINELGKSGNLARLDSILKSLPQGKTGQTMLTDARKILEGLSDKLEKLTGLAETIMKAED